MKLSDGNTIVTTGIPGKGLNPLRRRLSPLFGIMDLETCQPGCHQNSAQTLKLRLARSRYRPDAPLFSVIMTIKSAQVDLLTEALLSLEAQTFDSLELVCVCDQYWVSEYVQQFCADWGITLVLNYTTQYRTRTERFNAAVEMSRGDFCIVLDADDLLHPDALWVLAKCLDQFPFTNWFSGSHLAFVHNTDEKVICKVEPIAQMLSSLSVTFKQRHLWGFRNDYQYWPPGIFQGDDWVEDYNVFVHLAMTGTAVLPIPHVLYAWRQHEQQWTRQYSHLCDEMCDRIRKRCQWFLSTQKPYWHLGDTALAARMTRAMVMLENNTLTHPMR